MNLLSLKLQQLKHNLFKYFLMLRILYTFKRIVRRLIEYGELDRKEKFFRQAFSYCAQVGVDGDYFEFGVFKGRSFIQAYHTHKMINRKANPLGVKSNIQRNFYAFDSFKGLPKPRATELNKFRQSQFSFSKNEFIQNLKRNKVDLGLVTVVSGFYKDSLNSNLRKKFKSSNLKIAIIYLDCDIYSSTLEALNFCDEFFQEGTVICFDDYFSLRSSKNNGQIKALRDFKSINKKWRFVEWGPQDQYFKSFILQRN